MPPAESPIPDDVRRQLDEASKVAAAVDQAVSNAVPEIIDIQVAASPSGIVVLSGIAPSAEAAMRADAAARAVAGVLQFINSLTVA